MTPKQEIAVLSVVNLISTGALVAWNKPQYAAVVGSVLGAATLAVSLHGAGASWGQALVSAGASLGKEGLQPMTSPKVGP